MTGDYASTEALATDEHPPQQPATLVQLWRFSRSFLASTALHVMVIVALAIATIHSNVRAKIELTSLAADPSLRELSSLTVEYGTDDVSQPVVAEAPDLAALVDLDSFPDESLVTDPTGFAMPQQDSRPLLKQIGRPSTYDINQAGTGTSFFGIAIAARDVVYIVDRSGSMQGPRWESARGELLRSIDSLSADQQFFVFLFSDSCHPMPQIAGRNKLVPASEENKEEIRKWLLNQEPASRTEPRGCVARALKMEPDVVFLLSDGLFQDDTAAWLMKRARMRQNVSEPESLVIHTIAFHSHEVWHMLRQIADMYGGTFRAID